MAVCEVFPSKGAGLVLGTSGNFVRRFSGEQQPCMSGVGAGNQDILLEARVDESAKEAARKMFGERVGPHDKLRIHYRAFHLYPDEELPMQIKQVALDYGLMSGFTAFIAVDQPVAREEARQPRCL
jgi:hypothetical protein